MEIIINEFGVPEEIAAVTLVAFGSAVPEIMLNTISVIEHTTNLSLPETLGSAMIAFGFIRE